MRVNTRRRARRKDPIFRLWQSAQARAHALHAEFTITMDDVRSVWRESCPIFAELWGPGNRMASLDRLRADRGYVPGNIAVISMKANLIKSNATAREVELVSRWMKYKGL